MGRERIVQGGDGDRQITSTPKRGPGKAFYEYAIKVAGKVAAAIIFQKGCARKVGWNGCTDADLIDIEVDRFTAFQTGPYACDENRRILKHLDQIKKLMKKREARANE